jgi:hypothetical protein
MTMWHLFCICQAVQHPKKSEIPGNKIEFYLYQCGTFYCTYMLSIHICNTETKWQSMGHSRLITIIKYKHIRRQMIGTTINPLGGLSFF